MKTPRFYKSRGFLFTTHLVGSPATGRRAQKVLPQPLAQAACFSLRFNRVRQFFGIRIDFLFFQPQAF